MRTERHVFVDTNILMYAGGRDPEWRAVCKEALRTLLRRDFRPVTNAEVLQEILYRYFSQRRIAEAEVVHRAALELCTEVLPVTAHHTVRALEILLEYPGLPTRDAVHVATMEAAGVRTMLSVDTDFDAIPSVDRIDPRDFVRA